MFFKKGLSERVLLFLIVGVVSLVILLVLFKNLTGVAKYYADNAQCKSIFSTAANTNTFSDTSLSNFLSDFFVLLSSSCSSFKIEDSSPEKAGKFINGCWNVAGSGEIILPPRMVNNAFCYYCGSVSFDNDYKKDVFFNRFDSSVGEDFYSGEVVNSNDFFFRNFEPNKNEEYDVVYFSYRGNRGFFDNFLQEVGNFLLSDLRLGLIPFVSNFFSPDKTYGGIYLLKSENEKDLFKNFNSCQFVVPENSRKF